jgi:hypothetical protein
MKADSSRAEAARNDKNGLAAAQLELLPFESHQNRLSSSRKFDLGTG